MAKNIQIFKGGWSDSHGNRLAVNQRPADGHLKSAVWEDYVRLNKHCFKHAALPKLAVGDVIAIHTTLTLGLIDSLGIVVRSPEEGLKFKVVTPDNMLNNMTAYSYEYDAESGSYTQSARGQLSALQEIGDHEIYIVADASPEPIRTINTFPIGLEVVALPAEGLQWTFDIESRLHMRQPARPPACMSCC